MSEYKCPFCLCPVDISAPVCKTCGREITLVKQLEEKIAELTSILSLHQIDINDGVKRVKENKAAKRQDHSSIYLFTVFVLLAVGITWLAYGFPDSNFHGIEYQTPALLGLSFCAGFASMLITANKNVYMFGLVSFAICLIVWLPTKYLASFQDARVFDKQVLITGAQMSLSAVLGGGTAAWFHPKISVRSAFDLNFFFKKLDSTQSAIEQLQNLLIKVSVVAGFIFWLFNKVIPIV